MTGRFERMKRAFKELPSKTADCRNEATSDMADIREAYDVSIVCANVIGTKRKRAALAPPQTQPFARFSRMTRLSERGFVELASTSKPAISSCSTRIMYGFDHG
jgi:hypothetical protein